jgi:hypothetical protein
MGSSEGGSTILYFLTYNGELLLVASGTLQRIKRAVMPNLPLPLPMEIVCHHIDEVQILRNLRNIVTAKVNMGF